MIKKIPTILVLFASAVFLAGCGKKEDVKNEAPREEHNAALVKLTRESIKQIGLQTETISRKPFAQFISVPAKVLVNQDNEAQVGSLVQGRVCKVFVKIGDYVKAGQELMMVEGLEIGEIKARFLSARANLEYEKANFERQKKLLEEKIGAHKSLLESQKDYHKALAEYSAEENRIHAIGLSTEELVDKKSASEDRCSAGLPVKAPINGIVVERNVVIGQLIEGATNAFKIINLSSVWIDGQLYEKDIRKLRNKTAVTFIASSYPDEPFFGKISYLGQTIDEKTRTITIRGEFSNANGKLKPQMFGEFKIPNENNGTALIVPAEALIKIDNADFIFVQTEDSTFEKRPVSVGSARDEMVEIAEGLKEGEHVVVKGAFYLKSELMKSSLGEGE
jgi:membrane fusion protein, heavy metal efflux system